MTPMEIEGLLTSIETDPEADALFPYSSGGLAMNLYLELCQNWDSIPPRTRAVMAHVGASLKRQYYRELQAEIDAKQLSERLSRRDR